MENAAAAEKSPKKISPTCMVPFAAEAVSDPAAGQQQAGEGQAVGIDDPLQGRDRRPQVPAQRRQGHIDDGVVDHDQEDGQAENREDDPAAIRAEAGDLTMGDSSTCMNTCL